MYIIYLYIIYILFISLVRLYYLYPIYISCPAFQKFFPNGPPHVCYDLIVTCYLLPLIVKIVPAQGCLVGSEQTCVPTLLLFVMIAPAAHGNARPCEGEKCFTVFAIQPQSQAVCNAIDPRFHINRRFRCFTLRDG